jgi:hypothetical protein
MAPTPVDAVESQGPVEPSGGSLTPVVVAPHNFVKNFCATQHFNDMTAPPQKLTSG